MGDGTSHSAVSASTTVGRRNMAIVSREGTPQLTRFRGRLPPAVARDMLRAVPPPGVAHVAPAHHPTPHPRDRRAPRGGAPPGSAAATGARAPRLHTRGSTAEPSGPARPA